MSLSTILLTLLSISTIHANICYNYDGYFCSQDCNQLYKCINYNPAKVIECSSHEYCNMLDLTCTSGHFTPGTCAPVQNGLSLINHTCRHFEPIPHVTDCTKFYECHPKMQLNSCPDGFSFNLESKKCDLKLENNPVCQKGLTKKCTASNLGESEAIANNTNLYSLCTFKNNKYAMDLIQCEYNLIFNNTEQQCMTAQ